MPRPSANKLNVELHPVQMEWIDQMSIESGISRPELVRRGLKRLMSAYPVTSDDQINERVALYLHRTEM